MSAAQAGVGTRSARIAPASSAKAAADEAAKVNSPSRLFRDGTGRSISEGLAVGILDGGGEIEDAARKSVGRAFDAAQREVDTSASLQFGASNLRSFAATVSAKVDAALADAGIATKAPTIVAHIPVIVDGKVVDSRVETIIGEWEKEVLAGSRAA